MKKYLLVVLGTFILILSAQSLLGFHLQLSLESSDFPVLGGCFYSCTGLEVGNLCLGIVSHEPCNTSAENLIRIILWTVGISTVICAVVLVRGRGVHKET